MAATIFYYDINKILDRVETAGLYAARNIKQEKAADFYQLSIVDARDFLADKLRTISARMFADIFSQYARNITDPYLYDTTFEGSEHQIIFQVEFPTTKFDSNLIPSICQKGEDVLIQYLVSEWLIHSNYDYRKAEETYQEGKREMLGLVSRRQNYSRTYKTL
jgi:hypothetical protein